MAIRTTALPPIALLGALASACSAPLPAQAAPTSHHVVRFAGVAQRTVDSLVGVSRDAFLENAACVDRWQYRGLRLAGDTVPNAPADTIVVEHLAQPRDIAWSTRLAIYAYVSANGRAGRLCPGTQPLLHTHLLAFVKARTPSCADRHLAAERDTPWDIVVDVAPKSADAFVMEVPDKAGVLAAPCPLDSLPEAGTPPGGKVNGNKKVTKVTNPGLRR